MTDKSFADMTSPERRKVLLVLTGTLRLSSLIAEQNGDPLAHQMSDLAARLERDAEEIAVDTAQTASTVIQDAIQLSGKFELLHPGGQTFHQRELKRDHPVMGSQQMPAVFPLLHLRPSGEEASD